MTYGIIWPFNVPRLCFTIFASISLMLNDLAELIGALDVVSEWAYCEFGK